MVTFFKNVSLNKFEGLNAKNTVRQRSSPTFTWKTWLNGDESTTPMISFRPTKPYFLLWCAGLSKMSIPLGCEAFNTRGRLGRSHRHLNTPSLSCHSRVHLISAEWFELSMIRERLLSQLYVMKNREKEIGLGGRLCERERERLSVWKREDLFEMQAREREREREREKREMMRAEECERGDGDRRRDMGIM